MAVDGPIALGEPADDIRPATGPIQHVITVAMSVAAPPVGPTDPHPSP